MPELPEVEVVRRGLERGITGRTVAAVEVCHPRPVRRHPGGPEDFAASLTGRTFGVPRRRGKYLWLPFTDGDALLAHLGMSGQFRLAAPAAPDAAHTRVRFAFTDGGPELRFADQRMFGGLSLTPGGAGTPPEIVHIGRDPFEPDFDPVAVVGRLRQRRTGVKRALLDQRLVSGIGNIYADEALWRSRLHYARATDTLPRSAALRLLREVTAVMGDALAAGGTSFDALYVDVDGAGGSFERALAVYGHPGRPCPRCGTPIRREPFMNRSSFRCPRCQRVPRYSRW